MIKNFKIGKRFLSGVIAVSIIGSGMGGLHLYKRYEVNRVKNYLEDFLTEDNYVDLSKINKNYNIKDFSGSDLEKALEELDVRYVRISDAYIYNDDHVEGFIQKSATNYDVILGIDDKGNVVYEGYEPIRYSTDIGVSYEYPDGFELEDILVYAEPIRYNELGNREVKVIDNDYEDSYSLVLGTKKWM